MALGIINRRAMLTVAVVAVLGAATMARGELGGKHVSIDADRAHFAATMTRSAAPRFTAYTLQPASGGTLREFADADDVVFAISWSGPARPDLRQLLGSRFAAFDADGAMHGGRRMRRHVAVSQADFVVRSSGHPGAFFGIAYMPGLLPAGITADDLR